MATDPSATRTPPPERAADCCAAFYEQDWVQRLAEDSFHPGGEDLSRRTVEAMSLAPGSHVADIGCGTGTTALLLAGDYKLRATGLDISEANLEKARSRAAEHGLPVDFRWSDGRRLPFGDASLDGLLAECSFSLLPDKAASLAEFRRVLNPGGKLAITDMCLGGELPEDLARVLAPWTCLADALEPAGYLALFHAGGFEVDESADESAGLAALIGGLKRKLLLLGTGAVLAGGSMPPLDLGEIRGWMDRFAGEVSRGRIAYFRFNLVRPG